MGDGEWEVRVVLSPGAKWWTWTLLQGEAWRCCGVVYRSELAPGEDGEAKARKTAEEVLAVLKFEPPDDGSK